MGVAVMLLMSALPAALNNDLETLDDLFVGKVEKVR